MRKCILVAASCLMFGMTAHAENHHEENWHERRKHYENSVPEIGTGAASSALALAAGGLLLLADRRRKHVAAQSMTG